MLEYDTMKLTNTLRDASVSAVMQDTPAVDYDAQIDKAVRAAVLASLPKKLRDLRNDEALRDGYMGDSGYMNVGTKPGVAGLSIGGLPGTYRTKHVLPPGSRATIDELCENRAAQIKSRDALRSRLRAVAYACTTRKSLADALPEFEKYPPPELGPASRSLPVVAGVVADFVKAGWPKGKQVPA